MDYLIPTMSAAVRKNKCGRTAATSAKCPKVPQLPQSTPLGGDRHNDCGIRVGDSEADPFTGGQLVRGPQNFRTPRASAGRFEREADVASACGSLKCPASLRLSPAGLDLRPLFYPYI